MIGAFSTAIRTFPQAQPTCVVGVMTSSFLVGAVEEEADVLLEVIEAFARQRRVVSCLGKNEGALDYRLRVARQAFGRRAA